MRKQTMRKVISLLLVVILTVGSLLNATASTIVGDINGDGKVSVFDAQMLLEVQKGLRQLTDAQQAAAGKLSVADILSILFGTYVDESVQVGDVYKFTELAGENNGDNGLTFYYTTDGTTLTPYSLYDSSAACWYETPDNWKVSAVYPSSVPADNYGAGKSYTGTSVVMGFTAPATGTVDLYSWAVLQSDYDYQVSIAKGTVGNVLHSYDVAGSSQQAVANTYSIFLTEGQELYLIYTPTESADYMPFGYITSVTYTELGGKEPATEPTESTEPTEDTESTEPESTVQAGDTFQSAVLAPVSANGENGMTYYYTADGKTLTPFTTYDPNNHGGRWYNIDTATRSFVDPFVIPADNYGWIGTSAACYVVVGYEMPAAGQISLYNWLALHTGHDCRMMVAQGSVDNTVDVYDVIGAAETVVDQTVTLNVAKGEMVYVIYQPLETTETADSCYYGYKTQFTYLSVGEVTGSTTQDTAAVSTAIKNRTDAVAANAGLAALDYDVQLKPIGTRGGVYTNASYENGVATFTYTDGQTSVDYVIDTAWEKVQTGLIEVQTRRNGGSLTQAVTNAGTGYRNSAGKVLTPYDFAAAAQVTLSPSFDAATGTLTLAYRETYQGVTTEKCYTVCLDQKSLVIHATSDNRNGKNGYADFRAGSAAGLTSPGIDNSVYAEEVSVTVVDDTYFLSAYIDKAKTFATKVENDPARYSSSTDHGMTATYELNSAGQTNPLNEIFYVTVSDSFLDCVYLTNGEKSQYRDVLNDLVVYDNWEYTTSYTQRKDTYADLAQDYGLSDILLVEHRWQRDTLDISNPAHYPASTEWGTAAEFADYIATVKDTLGWTLALHEDYWFMYPSAANQYWNVANVNDLLAQNADGSLRYGWQKTSYANRSDMMVVYAQQESTKIENAYDPGASFLDVNGGVDPSLMNQVTLNAESTTSRTLAQVVADNVALFAQERDIYQGPVISEGAQGERSFGSAYAGYLDAGSREITDCSECRIMPDYELIYIRPLMANQGMGPLSRFQENTASDAYNFDKYNATCIAYGHAGFIGDVHYSLPLQQEDMINTYYMFRALQPQYLDSSVTVEEITYYTIGGSAMDLDAAVKAGYDFTAARLYIRYSNGLEMYLNFSDSNWAVTLNGNSYTLDKNGYCAENPGLDFIQYSCLRGGVRVDYVSCREYTYANPRGNTVDFGGGLVGNLIMLRSDEVSPNVTNPTQTAPIKFTDLAASGNGTKGLSFYYTADGKTLTSYKYYDASMGRWYDNTGGQLNFVDPREVLADNYGIAQTSASKYVVMGYEAPSTGTIELYAWTALQNGSGYEVSVALGSLDNVVGSYTATTAGEAVLNIYTMTVTEGETIYLIYKPITPADGEWFGYITSVTYK